MSSMARPGRISAPKRNLCPTGHSKKHRILIANRGEIASRVIRSAHSLGLDAVAVFTEPDALSSHVHDADETVCLGASPREYTNADKLMEAIKSTGYAPCIPFDFNECVIWAHMVHDSSRFACPRSHVPSEV